ncbi:hypothetical protein H0H93_006563 [Arthromyces matolae]|nr:hypothetical protein H0H93_006563 [Arthromyces matolae]
MFDASNVHVIGGALSAFASWFSLTQARPTRTYTLSMSTLMMNATMLHKNPERHNVTGTQGLKRELLTYALSLSVSLITLVKDNTGTERARTFQQLSSEDNIPFEAMPPPTYDITVPVKSIVKNDTTVNIYLNNSPPVLHPGDAPSFGPGPLSSITVGGVLHLNYKESHVSNGTLHVRYNTITQKYSIRYGPGFLDYVVLDPKKTDDVATDGVKGAFVKAEGDHVEEVESSSETSS